MISLVFWVFICLMLFILLVPVEIRCKENDRFSDNIITLERVLDIGLKKDQMVLLGFHQDFETKSFYFPIKFEGFIR